MKKKVLLTFLGVCLLIGIVASACGTTETEPAATKPAEKTVTVEKSVTETETVTETEPAEAEEAEPVEEAPVEEAEPVEQAPEYTTAQENAIASAKDLDYDSFSRQGLIEQLESEYGEGFTHAQAVYGVNQTGL